MLATATAVVLALAATVGGRIPTSRALPVPPTFLLNLSRDADGLLFPHVTTEFIDQQLGPGVSAFPVPAPVAPARPQHPSLRRQPPLPSAPGPSPSPRPSMWQPLTFSDLAVVMAADRSRVAPGDTITYRITVTNVGNQDFRGTYQLMSHIPFGTVDATTPCDGTLGVDPAGGCVNPPVPTPGSPDQSVHQFSASFSLTLARGAHHLTVIKVRVNETTQTGTRLLNHAHLDVVGDGKSAKTSPTVVVTVAG